MAESCCKRMRIDSTSFAIVDANHSYLIEYDLVSNDGTDVVNGRVLYDGVRNVLTIRGDKSMWDVVSFGGFSRLRFNCPDGKSIDIKSSVGPELSWISCSTSSGTKVIDDVDKILAGVGDDNDDVMTGRGSPSEDGKFAGQIYSDSLNGKVYVWLGSEWADVSGEGVLPDATAQDVGKLLYVDSEGNWSKSQNDQISDPSNFNLLGYNSSNQVKVLDASVLAKAGDVVPKTFAKTLEVVDESYMNSNNYVLLGNQSELGSIPPKAMPASVLAKESEVLKKTFAKNFETSTDDSVINANNYVILGNKAYPEKDPIVAPANLFAKSSVVVGKLDKQFARQFSDDDVGTEDELTKYMYILGSNKGTGDSAKTKIFKSNIFALKSQTATSESLEQVDSRISELYDGKFSDFFEMGAITFESDNSWTYINSSVRARTKKGFLISLKAGDKMTLNGNGWKYYLGCKKADGTYWKSGWKTSDFVLTEDGEYVLQIATSPTEGEQSSLEQMIGAFNIVSIDCNGFFRNSDVLKELNGNCEKLKYQDIVMNFVGEGMSVQTTDFKVNAGEKYSVTLDNTEWNDSTLTSSYAKFAIRKKNGTSYTNISVVKKGAYVDKVYYFVAEENEEDYSILFRGDVGETLKVKVERVTAVEQATSDDYGFIESLAHRGYSAVCPENTAIAYIEAYKHGFKNVEMDIRITADNKFVCIHNETIDSTSDGTGYVREMTVEQLKQYDFGSYKGEQFAGQKILTFEEFIQLCVRVGIHPYIDIKNGYNYLGDVADIIHQYQMEDKVSFMSYETRYLSKMAEYFPYSRLCKNMDSVTQDQIDELLTCKTGKNKVVVNAVIRGLTEDGIALVKAAKLPLQVAITDSLDYIRNLNPYITAVLSKRWVAGKILFEQAVNGDNK